MTRRIVQIAAVGHENNEMWQGRTELFALCDDSTAWYQVHGEAAWVPIPDIPQDTPAESPDPQSRECPDCGYLKLLSCVRCDGTVRVPAESPDPIAELEAMGGRLGTSGPCVAWLIFDGRGRPEECEAVDLYLDHGAKLADLRAAAARLLERVRGSK